MLNKIKEKWTILAVVAANKTFPIPDSQENIRICHRFAGQAKSVLADADRCSLSSPECIALCRKLVLYIKQVRDNSEEQMFAEMSVRFGVRHHRRDSLQYADTLQESAELKLEAGAKLEALDVLRESICITESLRGRNSVEMADRLCFAGSLYEKLQRSDEAEKAYREAIATRERLGAVENSAGAKTFNDLGSLLCFTNRADEGMKLLERGLQIQASSTNPTELVDSLLERGILLTRLKKYSEAEEVLGYAVDASKHVFAATNPCEIAVANAALATVYDAVGKLLQARTLFIDALATLAPSYADNSPEVGHVLQQLAAVHRKLGENEKAEKLLLRIFQCSDEDQGKRSATFFQLLEIYKDREDLSNVLPLLEVLVSVAPGTFMHKVASTWISQIKLRGEVAEGLIDDWANLIQNQTLVDDVFRSYEKLATRIMAIVDDLNDDSISRSKLQIDSLLNKATEAKEECFVHLQTTATCIDELQFASLDPLLPGSEFSELATQMQTQRGQMLETHNLLLTVVQAVTQVSRSFENEIEAEPNLDSKAEFSNQEIGLDVVTSQPTARLEGLTKWDAVKSLKRCSSAARRILSEWVDGELIDVSLPLKYLDDLELSHSNDEACLDFASIRELNLLHQAVLNAQRASLQTLDLQLSYRLWRLRSSLLICKHAVASCLCSTAEGSFRHAEYAARIAARLDGGANPE